MSGLCSIISTHMAVQDTIVATDIWWRAASATTSQLMIKSLLRFMPGTEGVTYTISMIVLKNIHSPFPRYLSSPPLVLERAITLISYSRYDVLMSHCNSMMI